MASIVEQATVAFVALVAAIPSITVKRNEDVPVNFVTASLPVVNIVDVGDVDGAPHFPGPSPRYVASDVAEFAWRLDLAGYVTANASTALGPARDALRLAVTRVVNANRVLTSSGTQLTFDVLPGSAELGLESEPGKPVAVFRMPVTLYGKSQISDPAIAA